MGSSTRFSSRLCRWRSPPISQQLGWNPIPDVEKEGRGRWEPAASPPTRDNQRGTRRHLQNITQLATPGREPDPSHPAFGAPLQRLASLRGLCRGKSLPDHAKSLFSFFLPSLMNSSLAIFPSAREVSPPTIKHCCWVVVVGAARSHQPPSVSNKHQRTPRSLQGHHQPPQPGGSGGSFLKSQLLAKGQDG